MTSRQREEYAVEPRVSNIEQQLQERLPAAWRAFAGKPMHISYYDKKINTFRANPELRPSAAYVRSAVKQLREQLAARQVSMFSDDELEDIVRQEWRTDMTRCVWQTRLNRHGSADGPTVRRSRNGMIYVCAPSRPGDAPVVDEIATPPKKKKASKATV
ncbi:hypothetical protein PINS_up020578 [Pythium insidiosum]|nr:hypothetical protein PINS_up001075 [Pythium insidiosum]GLE09033.1 hypothetical protein PINS_up020578 [Pythium insidiosum]